ncbi:T6SS immunity protein Tli4 family protein [Leclercia sp. S52]|uniref:T6SS immunity protein Tli4 family protein n=1 Tax=Leclercia sp. S52 TaxID=3138178 RepID=UPI0032190855
MKSLTLLLPGFILYSCYATAREWKSECMGYYQLMLPENVEVALYPIGLILEPRKDPAWRKDTFVSRYLSPKISFGDNRYQNDNDEIQAQFSQFYYGNYEIIISSENKSAIDLLSYKKQFKERIDTHIQDYWNSRDYELSLKLPVLSKEIAIKSLAYSLDNYTDAFSASDSGGYSVYINKNKRLYIFNKPNETQSLDEQLISNKPEIPSLLKHFQSRELYEVPTEQGFCIPYGFIAGDSGHEPRNMAVTYRLKNHPDVTIFFQDLGMKPKAGKEDDMNEKDYVTWLWNWQYQWSAVSKKLISPKWRTIEMDGRKGVGTFVKSIYKDGSLNYGYVAYVKGDRSARNLTPDLLLYVMQDSRQAKENPPMDKDELEKMAERITSSIRKR